MRSIKYLPSVVESVQLSNRIQSSHIPPCHKHMVIATILSVPCLAVLHRSANQTSAECCLEFTARGGYRMFLGLSGSALPHPLAPVSHQPCTLRLVSTLPHSLWLTGPFPYPVSCGADNSNT